MKIKNVEIGGYIQPKKDSKQLIAGHCYQVAEKDVSDKTVRLFSVDGSLDDSLWFCVSDFRKPRPQFKQLDQSVFNGLDEKWRWFGVNSDGSTIRATNKPKINVSNNGFILLIGDSEFSDDNYDATNWQNSLIERDTAKDLAGSELTGSELCRAMLARGDKYVMCLVNDDNNIQVISGWTWYGFTSTTNKYCLFKTPIPINNQGEPLTAAEVGL